MLAAGRFWVLALAVILALLSACCGDEAVTPAPTLTPTVPSSSSSPRPTHRPTLTPTPAPTETPSPTEIRAPTQTRNPGPTQPPATATPYVLPTPRAGWRPDGSRGVIALTFDTDSVTGYASAILDTLEARGARSSFGVAGPWAQAHPDLVQQMVGDGDTVMNHGWSHTSFTVLSREQRLSELARTDEAVLAAAGVSTKPYFRPPNGAVNASVRQDAADAGYSIVQWTIDPQGWRGKSWEAITANVFANARDGGIALFHINAYGDYQALGPVIDGLWNAGYRFVTIA